MKSILLTRIFIGDCDDPVIYAGFAIHEWQQSEQAQQFLKYNLTPTMWKIGTDPSQFSQTVELWCEEYDPKDLVLARLAGILDK